MEYRTKADHANLFCDKLNWKLFYLHHFMYCNNNNNNYYYYDNKICPREWDAQTSQGFWPADGSSDLGQTTRPTDSQQKREPAES